MSYIELISADKTNKTNNTTSDIAIGGISLNQKTTIYQEDKTAIVDKLATQITLDALIIQPNISDDDPNIPLAIMRIVNNNRLPASRSSWGSTVIEPGKIGILLHNGNVKVAAPGRYMKLNPRSSWISFPTLTQLIQYESLTIVRIIKGNYGLAEQNGKPLILGEGLHVRNSRLFRYFEQKPMNSSYINHRTIHIIRVPIGNYAAIIENNIPKILTTGFYVVDSIYFSWVGLFATDSEHIEHSTIHIVRVPRSFIALITYNNKPALLGEGTYVFNSQLFSYVSKEDINKDVITHSTITRFRIKNGEIGLAWHKNKPVFINKPDIYEIDDPTFIFVRSEPATRKLIQLGSRTRFIVNSGEICMVLKNNKPLFIEESGIYEYDDPTFVYKDCVLATTKQIILGSLIRVIVYEGEVGISYVTGKLDILQPHTHIFDTNDRVFTGFVSTKQQAIQLIEEGSKDPFLRCDTRDFVEVGIKAAVFFCIGNPRQTLLTVGDDKAINKIIKETSIATLQGILRSSALNQVAQSKVMNIADEKGAPIFFDKVHDEFISKLYETFKKQYGIEISNIRIESFKIIDDKLANSISGQALLTASTENQLSNLESQREIATAQQHKDSEVIRIRTAAEALKKKTDTEAATNAILVEAETKAKAIKLTAEAEASAAAYRVEAEARAKASAIRQIGEAEAQAIEMRYAAEKKRADNLNSSEIGQKLALTEVQCNMIGKSMQNIQKVICLPSGSNMSGTLMQMFGMPGMQLFGVSPSSDVPKIDAGAAV